MKGFLLYALAIVCASVFCSNCVADDTWTINTVAYGVTGQPSVAVDINNNPVVAFTSTYSTYSTLYTATQAPAGYQVAQVGTVFEAGWPRTSFTSNNELTITFIRPSGIWYASKSDWFDWFFSQVAENTPYAYPDIALTSNDIPHLACVNGSGYVEHAFFDIHSQQWPKETLSGFGQLMSGYAKIDIDSSGKILICGFDSTSCETLCSVYSNGFWNYLPAIEQALFSDCSFTADGLPTVAYIKSNTLCYAVYVNDIIGWVETQIAYCSASPPVSLGHSSTGIPGIAYYPTMLVPNAKLMYATNIAGGWATTEIDTFGGGRYALFELIFDRNDKPLIVYNSVDNRFGWNLPVIKLAGIGLASMNNAFDISGRITDRVTGLPIANASVYWLSDTFDKLASTTTDVNGFYKFDDMPPGVIDIQVTANYYADDRVLDITFSGDINNLDFALVPRATLSGKVLDNVTGQPIPNVPLEYHIEYDEENSMTAFFVSDANGNFSFSDLWHGTGEVKAKPYVESGYAWNLPWGADFINLSAGEHRSERIIFLEKGALVSGHIKDANADPIANFEFYCAGRNCDVSGSTDANGLYQIRLPKGTFNIQPSNDDVFGMLNKTFTITDINNDVNLSDIIVYTSATGEHISGDINNPGEYAKNGIFEIHAFKAGTNLNNPNSYYVVTSAAYLNMDNAGAFSLNNLPPDVNYDIYLMAYSKLSDGRDSQTVRSISKNIALDTNNVYLEYNSTGSTIRGYVKNINGQPILGAAALLSDSHGDFKGYCETDSNGLYTMYNVPAAHYTITAVHSKYNNFPVKVDISDGNDANASEIIMPFDGSKEGPDLNGNGVIDLFDIAELSTQWLDAGTNEADLNQDGFVNFLDWLPIADNWMWKAIWLNE